MATGFDHANQQKLNGNGTAKRKTKGATYFVQTDKKGRCYIQHPQHGRLEVIALYCDCGRSVLVNPKEVKESPIICGLCNRSFSWQQLTFVLD